MNIKKKVKENDNNKINKKRKITEINKKYLKNGSYSFTISAIFVCVIIVINLIAGELPSKYTQLDVSEGKLYSIGDQTKEVLKGLEKDVTIYQIAQEGSEDETIANLLEKYADESKHVKVVKKDPVVNPKFVSEYTSEDISANSLVVVCGDRNKVIDYQNIYEASLDYTTYSYQTTGFDGEGQITSAIAYVTSEDLPILYTLEGHGEKELGSAIKEGIEKSNIQINSLNLLTEGTVPEDTDCLLINSPSTDISAEEKDAILEYLENGGKSMIFSDYTEEKLENFDSILENYGVKRADGIVFEGDTQRYGMQMPYYLIPEIQSTDASGDVASSGYMVLAPYAQGIQELEEVRDTLTVESLLTTSDSSYSKTNMNSDTLEKEAEDIEGPFDLGVSITETVGEDKETQIVYYSTANLMDNQINQLVSGGNAQMILSSLNWMTGSEEQTNVSIPSKNLQVSYLTLTAYDTSFWTICTIGLIPGFFLIVGFVVWYKRRKA